MSDLLIRLIILASVTVFALLLVWAGRRVVETRRQRAFAAEPPTQLTDHADTSEGAGDNQETQNDPAHIRILAFRSDDCRQCHQLQEPALRRVVEARGEAVSVLHIDAPTSPDLTQRYQVLTLPTTVLLDPDGKVHAVNYGFANTQRLLTQIDEVLAGSGAS